MAQDRPSTNHVHPGVLTPVAERTSADASTAKLSPAAANFGGTESPTADPSAASKLSNGAEMFRAALSDAWTVTEVARVVSVAHRGRLAVRIAASDVTPELVEHHRRWLSSVAL